MPESQELVLKPLRMPKYKVKGAGKDDFFKAQLEIEARTHFKSIEGAYRRKADGRALIATELQRFVDERIDAHLGRSSNKAISHELTIASREPPTLSRNRLGQAKQIGLTEGGRPIVECPVCKSPIRRDNLEKHFSKAHASRKKAKKQGKQKRASKPKTDKEKLTAQLKRATALRKRGLDTYTPNGGPKPRIIQGGAPGLKR